MTIVIDATPSRTETTACILCSRNCLKVRLDGDRIAGVRGDEAHVLSNGYRCQKAAHLDHYKHNEGRLPHPLKRMPNGHFASMGWELAITDITQRLLNIRGRWALPAATGCAAPLRPSVQSAVPEHLPARVEPLALTPATEEMTC